MSKKNEEYINALLSGLDTEKSAEYDKKAEDLGKKMAEELKNAEKKAN